MAAVSSSSSNLADRDPPAPPIEIGSTFTLTKEQAVLVNKISRKYEVNPSWVEQAIYFALKMKPPPAGDELSAEVSAWVLENHPRFTEEDDDDDDDLDTMDTAVDDGSEYKMVFVVNNELQMLAGKTAAQVAHGALNISIALIQNPTTEKCIQQWHQNGLKKTVLRAKDTKQLFDLKDKAVSERLQVDLVHDDGTAEILGGSVTCLVLFGCARDINRVTGALQVHP